MAAVGAATGAPPKKRRVLLTAVAPPLPAEPAQVVLQPVLALGDGCEAQLRRPAAAVEQVQSAEHLARLLSTIILVSII